MGGLAPGILLASLASVVFPVCGYLVTLTVAAPVGRRRRVPPAVPNRRFAILIPAHDEEAVIGRLLDSLSMLHYPSGLYDVHVVADNCADQTAAVARSRGAAVAERFDPVRRAKGWALQWLLGQIEQTGRSYDGYVVLDADSVVSANFLQVMNDHLEAGAPVVQAYYGVLPLRGTRAELLREASFALVHYLRPLAKMALGGSAGLKGNGMCFHCSIIERFGWPAAGLAEDVEFHLTLVRAGIRVDFAPEATVRAEMPSSLAGARSQQTRWESGRLAVLTRQALPLALRGIARRDFAALDAGLEQLVPPLSVPAATAMVCFVAGCCLRLPAVWLSAGALLALLALHVLAGLALAGVSRRVYLSLFEAPLYIPWKTALYLRALGGGGQQPWVRTARGESR